MTDFYRYSPFKTNGKIDIVPFIKIRKKKTDKYVKFNKKTMRLDLLSYEYYNNPDYAWLILQANSEHGSIENFLQDGIILRIPYPIEETLNIYLSDIEKYKELNY